MEKANNTVTIFQGELMFPSKMHEVIVLSRPTSTISDFYGRGLYDCRTGLT